MRSGPSTSKVSSRCATADTAIPSPSRTASADSCSSAEACIPHQSSSPSLYSSRLSVSSAYPPCSENGTPFASIGLARLTRLSAWWIRLGIPETIEPGKPQQNGRHERMHRTLKREATSVRRHFNDFRHTFNHIRPHEADDATVYRSALRAYPETLPPLEYPEHFEVRKVSTNGGIRWHSRWINISSALGNEFVGLEPIPALWQLYFGPTTLGWFDEELFVIFDTHGNTGRNPIC